MASMLWQITGKKIALETSKSFAKNLDPTKPVVTKVGYKQAKK